MFPSNMVGDFCSCLKGEKKPRNKIDSIKP